MQELQELALRGHSAVEKRTSGSIVCGKLYEQVIEETTSDFLQQTADPGEIIREQHLKRPAIIAGLQYGIIAFITWGVAQATACDSLVFSINNGNTSQVYFLPLLP